jgi:asparagine synthase (glutamine-hydrolysing)
MRMTPEDRFDRQPWRGASGAVIAADLRLDNRDDVLTRIGGIVPTEARDWPDSRISLTAWERLGEDGVRFKVMRRFANQQRVGKWQRRHSASGCYWQFLRRPLKCLNEEKFADFLVLNHDDHSTTIYQDIYRVPPAHLITVQENGVMNQRPYWSPADIKPIRLGSEQAYADGLHECLDRAVRRQMRSAHPIGCYLSGGLDSSSVAVLLARSASAASISPWSRCRQISSHR